MNQNMLCSKSNTYTVGSLLGAGHYGKVTKCIRREDMKTVAIKTQKCHPNKEKMMQDELKTLQKLRQLDPDKCNIVQFEDSFFTKGYFHLAFEHLEQSLQRFIGERENYRFRLQEIRPIVCQLANAFNHLSTLGLIHTDLKLDNVMLVNSIEAPYKVKLIDFGLAIDVSEAIAGSKVQPIPYRSPEIILGLPFTEAIDMWSLGSMTVHMFLGKPLCPSMKEYCVLKNIMETLGQPPAHMLCDGLYTNKYFKRGRKAGSLWNLKKSKTCNEMLGNNLTSLDDLLNIYRMFDTNSADSFAEWFDKVMFVDMLKEMLQLDPKERITPSRLLRHPFITGNHFVPLHTASPYFQCSYPYMEVCHCILADDRNVVCESLGEPTSEPAHPVQSGGLPDVNSHPNPGLINEPDCQSAPNKMVGIKRKGTNDVGTEDDTPCVSKRVKYERHGGGYADPATDNRSCDHTDQVQANAAVGSHPTQHHSVTVTSCQQQPDQRCVRTVIKRKSTGNKKDQKPKKFLQSQTSVHHQAGLSPQLQLQQLIHQLQQQQPIACGSLGEPTSGPAHPVQSGGLPDVNSHPNPGLINEPDCQSAPNKMVGIKRKGNNDVGTEDDTPCVPKRVKFERHGAGYADPATDNRSCDHTDQVQANAAVGSHPTQHHSVDVTSRQQQPDQRRVRTVIKRKSTGYKKDKKPKRFLQSQTSVDHQAGLSPQLELQQLIHQLQQQQPIVCGSLGEPTSGPAHPVQGGGLPDVNSPLNPGLINEPHCQSAPNKMVGIKRERTNDVGTEDETPCVSKRFKSERHGAGYADPATAQGFNNKESKSKAKSMKKHKPKKPRLKKTY